MNSNKIKWNTIFQISINNKTKFNINIYPPIFYYCVFEISEIFTHYISKQKWLSRKKNEN